MEWVGASRVRPPPPPRLFGTKIGVGEARVFTASVPLLGYRRADLLPVVCASLPPETHRPLASLCLWVRLCVCVRARTRCKGPR